MYNYLPHNEDELELKEGDIVDVMEKCDDGWFVGKFVCRRITFPDVHPNTPYGNQPGRCEV